MSAIDAINEALNNLLDSSDHGDREEFIAAGYETSAEDHIAVEAIHASLERLHGDAVLPVSLQATELVINNVLDTMPQSQTVEVNSTEVIDINDRLAQARLNISKIQEAA